MGEYSGSRAELPKNIRQIGERDEVVRLYVEDYVNTYLKQVYPSGGPGLRVGLLLGNSDPQQEVPCLFVDGALEMEEVVPSGAAAQAVFRREKPAHVHKQRCGR